jgi:uncharacterized coiled-coil DUF342 family protein
MSYVSETRKQERSKAMSKIAELKARFDQLVSKRDAARQRIVDDATEAEYDHLAQAVNTAYRDLMDARYEAGERRGSVC